jgi:hypothetical protein
MKHFQWVTFDVNSLLPAGWQKEIIEVAAARSRTHVLVPTSITSREASTDLRIPVMTVGGRDLRVELPWLAELYEGLFLELGQQCIDDPLMPAVDHRYGIVLNVQIGRDMRYECHVDSNPLEGLLYVTSHPRGSGGELVVANKATAVGVEEIEADCSVIYPEASQLVFFDARDFPHYVRPLNDDQGIRVAATMNFYTPSSPESARPRDLNRHLFGED